MPTILDVLFCVLIATVIVQSLYFIFIFGKFPSSNTKAINNEQPKVSVIICAKNEARNLSRFLPSILSQQYTDFEIVLINDGSSDDTLRTMEHFEKGDKRIKIVNVKSVDAFWGNKKYALTLGIKAASSDTLLFTDADCKPVSDQWISKMCSPLSASKNIVLGYSPYRKIKGSFLNRLIRFETFMTALQYFSYAQIGLPYMAVGRNFAYNKKLFFEANGFIKHIRIKSGDDDLFVNQVANSKNTSYCIEPDSFVESVPETNLKKWLRQKRRHVSTSRFYKLKHKIILGFFYLSQILFWLSAITLLSTLYLWNLVVVAILFRFVLQFYIFNKVAKKLGEIDLLYALPITEFVLIMTQFYIFMHNLISKPKHWK